MAPQEVGGLSFTDWVRNGIHASMTMGSVHSHPPTMRTRCGKLLAHRPRQAIKCDKACVPDAPQYEGPGGAMPKSHDRPGHEQSDEGPRCCVVACGNGKTPGRLVFHLGSRERQVEVVTNPTRQGNVPATPEIAGGESER